ncbi:hypothetical protein AMS68_006584 [Peltaster fructicola]|uniref:Chitin biosynthesis protein CHS5 n=1 Tax=Peltaster fructicola TaxID=286661 RepID=A0A6H0Y246_9PEZI|nr:hypothetical protein AMS68_006584 [Peltaster fructicola]
MLVSLTVGKVDAGVAVLLTEDKRLIEFPSILLPPDIHSGSIVDINVARNQRAEQTAEQKFASLQDDILTTFGGASPSPPVLRCRNATQTSVVLEWDPVELATAELRSLSLYRNGTKAGVIPRDKQSTKISGLALDTEYTFHLVLRTSAGQYSSEKLTVRTHKMTDLTGITITTGVMPGQLKDSLAETVNQIGAKLLDTVRIDTTHFVCTEPRGQAWEKAVEMNVPVVVPDWIKGCQREGRIVGVRSYYLDADPKHRQLGVSTIQQQRSNSISGSAQNTPQIQHTPPTPDKTQQESHEDPETGSIAGTTLAERPATVKEEDYGQEDDDAGSDDTERAIDMGREAHTSPSKTETTAEEAAEIAEEDGKFDEVSL